MLLLHVLIFLVLLFGIIKNDDYYFTSGLMQAERLPSTVTVMLSTKFSAGSSSRFSFKSEDTVTLKTTTDQPIMHRLLPIWIINLKIQNND